MVTNFVVTKFDITDHDLRLRKLAVYWLSPGTLTLLASFLTDRKQTVHVNASTSDVRSLRYGVPQGSVLGPLLFSIYINGFPLFNKACCELFADDTTIHSSISNLRKLSESLQKSVNSLLKWAEFNHMSLHRDKNKCMLITTRQKRQIAFEMPTYFHRKPNCEWSGQTQGFRCDHWLQSFLVQSCDCFM